MKYLFIVLLALSVAVGCTDNSDERLEILSHSSVDLVDEYISQEGDIVAFNEGIVGIEESTAIDEPLYVIRKDQGGKFRLIRFGVKGQRPDDFLHPYPLQYISDDVFGVYDMYHKRYKEVIILKSKDTVRTLKSVSF
jgi:signal peptidase I